MDAEASRLQEKVRALSDIELAVLLCLVADQHCIIEVEESLLKPVARELQIIASDVFGLTHSVLDCSEQTTLDDFGYGILVADDQEDYFGGSLDGRLREDSKGSISESPRPSVRRMLRSSNPLIPYDNRKIANVVIATNLNRANEHVQIQALELIRGKRNFTRTAVFAAPKPFLFIALTVAESNCLTAHLNDQFFIYHKHEAEDGLPHLESQLSNESSDDDASTSSVVRTPPMKLQKQKLGSLVFTREDIRALATQTADVSISSEVRAYLHNVVTFMRLHRAVAGGISALATQHLTLLSQALCPLHAISYVSPSLVALAARKVYPHRIVITTPENERSMQWGSSLEAVRAILDGVTPQDVIEEVLQSIEAPL